MAAHKTSCEPPEELASCYEDVKMSAFRYLKTRLPATEAGNHRVAAERVDSKSRLEEAIQQLDRITHLNKQEETVGVGPLPGEVCVPTCRLSREIRDRCSSTCVPQ